MSKNDIYSIYSYLYFRKRSFSEKDIFERISLGFHVNVISSDKQNTRKKVIFCKDVCDTFYDHIVIQKSLQYPAKTCIMKIEIGACAMNSILIYLKTLIALIGITGIFLAIFFRWSSMYHAKK